jgi:acetylornithine/N-succinyldiaminopimelate aminotransferase
MSPDRALISDHPLPKCFAAELLLIEKGEGVWLEDGQGNRYLDFSGGIAVNALGYGREDIARLAYEQMCKLTHISNLFITRPALELGRKMVASGPFQAVQFLSSGAEANETALKYARLYSLRKKGEACHSLLCFTGGFHGRTFGALSVTANSKYQDPFHPLLPGVEVRPYNDVEALEKTLDSGYAGVIVEVVQGEGGLASMSPQFAEALNRLCRRHDVLLIADEVQTGLGRTGSLFASSGIGLEPDLITLAKPLAGGLPLAAVLIPEKLNSLIHFGDHGTTFGGGPVTTAVASRVWDILSDPQFLAEVREKGVHLRRLLDGLRDRYPFAGEPRGRGLLQGVPVLTERLPAAARGREAGDLMAALVAAMRDKGLLVLRSGVNVLRIAPPLVISVSELGQGATIMGEVFDDLAAGRIAI